MEVNYNMPLEVQCVMCDAMPTQNGQELKWVKYRLGIMWKDINGVEEFVKHYRFPPHNHGQLAHIITSNIGTHLVCADFDTIFAQWNAYKTWVNSKPDFLFSRN